MVDLIKSDKLKIQIIKQFKKKNIDYTASYLSDLLNSKFETIQKALEFFVKMGILKKDIKEHGEKDYTYYVLTEIGKNFIKSLRFD